MEVILKNVGNIHEGRLAIKNNSINIKYGINGAGKSTLAKSIEAKIHNEDLSKFTTYGTDKKPEVTIDEKVEDCLSFNREYIRNYLFKDDIVNNSFEIMINTQNYIEMKKKIDNSFLSLVTKVKSDKLSEIEKSINDFLNSIKFNAQNKNGSISLNRTSKFGKSIGTFIVEKLNTEIENYKDNFNHAKSPEWYKWFKDGKNYIVNDNCPFCGKELDNNFNNTYTEVINASNNQSLRNSIDVKNATNKITEIISDGDCLKNITSTNNNPNEIQLRELKEIYDSLKRESEKIQKLKNLNVETIRHYFENDSLNDYLKQNLLTIDLYNSQNEEIKGVVDSLNKEIEIINARLELIKNEVNEFSEKISKNIKSQENEVNEIFEMAGIPYKIEVKNENDNYKTILFPKICNVIVDSDSLSYGERNAISLVLFSLEAKKTNGLIILDDPVSSFDNNKKYALLYYLFIKDNAPLKDKTVLLLTHDFNLVIDFNYKKSLYTLKPILHYFYNDNNHVKEKRIDSNKLHHIVNYYKNKALSSNHKVIRLINLRKYIELIYGNKSIEFDILSSLEHLVKNPSYKNDKKDYVAFEQEFIKEPTKIIKNIVNDFDYDNWLKDINSLSSLKSAYRATSSDVEKLQLARIFMYLQKNNNMFDENIINFITETYHIEDNYVVVLDENKFNQIPRFVINCLDKMFSDDQTTDSK